MEQFDKVGLDHRVELPKSDFISLKDMLTKLTSALAETTNSVEKNSIVTEKLNRTIEQLTTAIKKVNNLESGGISLQLTEAVTSLMDCHVNPRFYKDTKVLQLKRGHPAASKQPFGGNHITHNNNHDQELKNLYTVLLKNGLSGFYQDLSSNKPGVESPDMS
jgi:hypothetical protein